MPDRDKIFVYCDRAITACVCVMVFYLPFAKAGVEICVWSAIFIWILKRALGYRAGALWGMLPATGLNKALGILIAADAIATIFSAHFYLSLRGFFGKEIKFIAIYFMLIEVINSRQRVRNILSMFMASAALITCDAAVQYVNGVDFLRGYPFERLRASFPSANCFAGWLIVIIPLFLGIAAADGIMRKSLKAASLLLIPLLSGCLIMTYARGGWLGFAIGISLIAWYVFNNFSLKVRLACVSAVVAVSAVFLALPRPLQSRVQAKVGAVGRINFRSVETINARVKSTLKTREGSNPARINLWKEAVGIINAYPLTGCGLNTYSAVAPHHKTFSGGGIYPHNCFLQRAAETGLFGLCAFLWFLAVFFRNAFRHLSRRRSALVMGLLAGVSAFLVQCFFDTHLYSLQLAVLFWYVIGLTAAVIRLEEGRLI